jgi:flavin-dependent dehydrogenase
LGKDEVGVALLTGTRGRKLSDALPDFPAVRDRLAGAAHTSAMRGAVTRTCSRRDVIRGNIALLGDASGSVDAVTGEGLLSALQQANALANAIAAGEPKRYAAAHRQIAKGPRRMARLLLLLDRYPWLERRFVAVMAERPERFAALLRVHLREQSWPRFAWNEAAELLAMGRHAIRNSLRDTYTWLRYAQASHRERGL